MDVKCINQEWCGGSLTEGKVYDVISEEGEQHEYFKLVNDEGVAGVYYKERFVPVEDGATNWNGWDYGGGVDDPRY